MPLEIIYKEVENYVLIHEVRKFQEQTFRNTIRGELNKHEHGSKHKDNLDLFVRSSRGYYSLTEKGENYNGR